MESSTPSEKNHDIEVAESWWRTSPDFYAIRRSRGKWKVFQYFELIAEIVRDAILSGGGRIILTMPPRHGKTTFISHWVPTWFLDNFPEKRVVLTSYGESLARTSGRIVRNNLNEVSEVSKDSHAATEFTTLQGGGLYAAGMGGSITGRGADLLIIDDPIKTIKEAMSETVRQSHKDWFDAVAYTRLEPGATVIVCQTRWHEDDLAGYLINEHKDDWALINLPALAEDNDPLGRKKGEALCPERYTTEDLEGIKKTIGPRFFGSLYQGTPTPQEGSIFKRQFWKRWTTENKPETFDSIKQSWDPNVVENGPDYVVGQVWGKVGSQCYLLDQVRGKWGMTEFISKFKALSDKWPTATRKEIENKSNGPAVENMLKKTIQGIVLIEPKGGKEVRALAVEPTFEAGNIWIPADEVMYPWVKDLIEEAAIFPNGKNDDMVDTMTQAISEWFEASPLVSGGKDKLKEKTKSKLGGRYAAAGKNSRYKTL